MARKRMLKDSRETIEAAGEFYALLVSADRFQLDDQHELTYSVPDDETTEEKVLVRAKAPDDHAVALADNLRAAWARLTAALED